MKSLNFTLIAALLVGAMPIAVAADIDVYPTGDSTLDRANVHSALATAKAGDTILLRAGVFNLTPPETDPTNCSLDVAVPLPDGDSFRYWDAFAMQPDPCNPGAPDIFYFVLRNAWELFLIDKPLTIKGESGPFGPLTKLKVENRFSDIYFEIFEETGDEFAAYFGAFDLADSFVFLIGAADVTIKNIEFDGPVENIQTFWADTTIKNCVFRAIGQGPFFFLDERSIYPNYPRNFKKAVKSTFKHNVFINSGQGLHIAGSEIVVADNVFDHFGSYAVYVSPYASLSAPLNEGGMALPLVREMAQNNTIKNNTIVNGFPFEPRILVSSWWGGSINNNKIVNNTVSADGSGIILSESAGWPIDGTVLSDNKIIKNEIHTPRVGIGVYGGHGATVKSNEIIGASVGIYTEWGVGIADWNPNDPTLFMAPAVNGVIKDNVISNSDIGVLLGAFARDNTVKNNTIQGSGTADYQLNGPDAPYGPAPDAPTFGPASGNTLKVAPDSQVLDFSGCSNVSSCPQYDDDGDGMFGEDPADKSNNDGDLAFGYYSLVDEDPDEAPNRIVFAEHDDDDDSDDD